jgi:CBS domain-containing membrane protein
MSFRVHQWGYRGVRLLLAGATLRDRLIACLGAAIGIGGTALMARFVMGPHPALPLLIASFGASAVLVYAVPASPLAQPWPVIGGNVISALFGVMVERLVPVPDLAAGIAVGGSILVMSLTRCLHPPGAGTALVAVIGGPAVIASGAAFAFVPVGLNAVTFVALGLLFHRFSGHSYPHRPAVAASPVEAALHRRDIDRDDLEALLTRAEAHAQARAKR